MASTSDRIYWQNYRRFHIEFYDSLKNVAQCVISSSTTTPITGLSPTFASITAVEGGTSLFFEPIPREMLYTSVTKPQVKLTIDGIEAACANVNCDYEYTTSLASVTGQSLSGLELTIAGTNLPILGQTAFFGGASCSFLSSVTASS